MNAFELRRQLIEDYSDYVTSFLRMRDERIRTCVERELEAGLLWPPARIQLNPTFEAGGTVDEMVSEGLLHPRCGEIFRRGKSAEAPAGEPMQLHRHQAEALKAARDGGSYVLTTGTGSGKSLAYIVPIVDHVLREGRGKGIRAIVVYPMNALANSQMGELEKFLGSSSPAVRFARYTGQESEEAREAIKRDPPDVLLTNYVMLELILTRFTDRQLVRHAQDLRFLVLDELHTYRGRQGADVAMLVRRVGEACLAERLQCVGTSATLASDGSLDEQRAEVARVASRIFGDTVLPEHVIGETLERATCHADPTDPATLDALRARVRGEAAAPTDFAGLKEDVLASWVETTFGLEQDAETGRLTRATPRPLVGPGGAALDLAGLIDEPEALCEQAIERMLMAGHDIVHPRTRMPAFAFRLHQFISRGDTVHATVEPERERYITARGRLWAPGGRQRRLFPMMFCRECGQEYYAVRLTRAEGGTEITARDPSDRLSDDDGEAGYLYLSDDAPWPSGADAVVARLPDDWLEPWRDSVRVRRSANDYLPRPMWINPLGESDPGGTECAFLPTPFRMCLRCGVAHTGRLGSDFPRLATLGSEGRSTATTVIGMSVIRSLRRDDDLDRRARKLLSFTDNRQDASLQAGHFNDFVEVGLLRAALHRATVEAGVDGLRHDELAARTTAALDLPLAAFARNPDARYAALDEVQRALREVVGYRLYRDQRRGWRVTSPNLEQCGLLRIEYASLSELCEDEAPWLERHRVLAEADPRTREIVCRTLLDFLRRELAIAVDYLDVGYQDGLRQRSDQHLVGRWAIDETEQDRLEYASVVYPRARSRTDRREATYLSSRGGFGRYLKRRATFGGVHGSLTGSDVEEVIRDLLGALVVGGQVRAIEERGGETGFQVQASAMEWVAGDGAAPAPDPIRVPNPPDTESERANRFFAALYRGDVLDAHDLIAHEHTAQVPAAEREDREEAFREGRLPVLFCSPTMELGVDISDLPVVNMRNVPPTPANYAQRSGRAGRAGQPALVVTYCSTGSSHDQYFFRRPEKMVGGRVSPPRLDLGNEDLLRAHVHAVWLAETGASLGRSLREVLDVGEPDLPLLGSLRADLDNAAVRGTARARAARIIEPLLAEMAETGWYSPEWLDETIAQAPVRLDQACGRWRDLYRAALSQRDAQDRIAADPSRPAADKKLARRLRGQAEAQLDLLVSADEGRMQSDFYSYRYLAAEGFLPGYNFPRLPLSAFIPARRRGARGEGDYLNRPRFLAVSEFGPRSVLYHEGSRYVVNQVVLPVERADGDGGLPLRTLKRCDSCGYMHPVDAGLGADICEHCGVLLGAPLSRLLRLTNVSTRRRDRISSDEEERLRLGYELITGVRFAERQGQMQRREGSAVGDDDQEVLRLTYGASATLWRVNLGWARRQERGQLGFVLDAERGFWARNDQAPEDGEDPMSARTERVVPFVEDTRNVLTLRPPGSLDARLLISLMWALKSGIQAAFQLEDSELAAETLPDADDPRGILLYEASEGGAGVLRRLVDEPDALARAAREALALCHFDPLTGEDLPVPAAAEACEAACYDCLMSYSNQRVHQMLDRFAVRDTLLALAQGNVTAQPGRLERLSGACDSELERRWLRLLVRGGHRLPDACQTRIDACQARPDFSYERPRAAVYVDGPVHEFPERADRDATQTKCVERAGYRVLRFGSDEGEWPALLERHPDLFGTPNDRTVTTDSGEPKEQVDADLDLFPASWHPAIQQVIADKTLVVAPGVDVASAEGVVGSYIGAITRGARRVLIVDADDPASSAVAAELEDSGEHVVLAHAGDPELAARLDELLRA